MSETKYWLSLWQGVDNIDIDFGHDFNRRQSAIEALKDTDVRMDIYESFIDGGEGE